MVVGDVGHGVSCIQRVAAVVHPTAMEKGSLSSCLIITALLSFTSRLPYPSLPILAGSWSFLHPKGCSCGTSNGNGKRQLEQLYICFVWVEMP